MQLSFRNYDILFKRGENTGIDGLFLVFFEKRTIPRVNRGKGRQRNTAFEREK
jgi:hypothetical protein